jgi:hypothetical protein
MKDEEMCEGNMTMSELQLHNDSQLAAKNEEAIND